MSEVERFEHTGLIVSVGVEEDTEFADPRDMECNLGTMVCWHPGYVLGDFQVTNEDGRGAYGGRHGSGRDTRFHRDDFKSIRHLARYLSLCEGAVVVLPLYLLDHSGLFMSAGSNTVGRGDTASGGRDEFGNPRGWDTTLCGVIFTTRERVAELCGEGEDGAVYCPSDWQGDPVAWVAKNLADEIDVYDQWLRGEVYWYSVETADGDVLDSCGGFLGGGVDADGREIGAFEYVKQEAREAAEGQARMLEEAAAVELVEAERAARQDIATVAS